LKRLPPRFWAIRTRAFAEADLITEHRYIAAEVTHAAIGAALHAGVF